MAIPEFSVEPREETGKGAARKLRANGRIPGVLYGTGGEAESLILDPKPLKKAIVSSPTTSFLVRLSMGSDDQLALLKDFQVHPLRREILHADFQRIDRSQPMSMEAAVETLGTPVGVGMGGLLEIRQYFVMLHGLPDELPATVTVDVEALEIGDSVRVSDLTLPEGITTEEDPDMVLASVVAPQVIEEEVEEEDEEGEEGEGEGEGGEEAASAEAESE